MKKRSFSVNEFKDWLAHQKGDSDFYMGKAPDDPNVKYIGKLASPKVSSKKLLEKVKTKHDANQLVLEFCKDGGTILSISGDSIEIETKSGKMKLPRFCVKYR